MRKRRSGSGRESLDSRVSPGGEDDRASYERLERLREIIREEERPVVDLPSLPPRAKRWTLVIATVVFGIGLGLKALTSGSVAAGLKALWGG